MHVGVGEARWLAALVELLVDLQPRDRARRVDEAIHVIGLLRVVIDEPIAVHRVGDTHRDAFRAALGVDVRAVHLLAVDLLAGEELRDLEQLVPRLRRLELPIVFLLELGAEFGPREPILSIGPADGVGHRRQRPVVRRVLRPFGIGKHRRRHEIVHRNVLFGEEVVQLDVVLVLRRAADPLAVADDQVAEFAVRVELIDEPIGIAGPGNELVLHLDPGLFGEILAQLDQRVRRVPCGPAKRQRFPLCSGGLRREQSRDAQGEHRRQ